MVYLFLNENVLRSNSDVLRQAGNKKKSYWSGYPLSVDIEILLEANGFKKCPKFIKDEQYKKKFVEGYQSLIGKIGSVNNTKIWWATDLASKNRMSSKLPFFLEQFLFVMERACSTEEDVIFINLPEVILPSLENELKKAGIPFRFVGSKVICSLKSMLKRFRKVGAIFFNGAKVYFRSLYARRKLGDSLREKMLIKRQVYVIKTFIYDHSFDSQGNCKDSFFGKLPDFARQSKDVLLFANVIGIYGDCLDKIKACQNQLIVPYEMFLSLSDILQASFEALFSSINIEKDMLFLGFNVHDVLNRLIWQSFKGVQFHQFLHYWATRKLMKQVDASTFLFSFENYPWERMCVLAVRESEKNVKLIGYQHTVVPQAFLNMFIGSDEAQLMPLPDKVLTAGNVTKEIMERYSDYGPVKINTACALRYEYLFNADNKLKRKKISNVFIALEITLESYDMVCCIIKELSKDNKYKVKIRAHPALPWRCFVEKFGCKVDQYENFEISKTVSMKEDLDWADVVVYSGTTVGIEALMSGKPVIHFDRGLILSYDPLFESSYLKWTFSEGNSLRQIFKQIDGLSADEFKNQHDKAKKYIEQYFYPISDKKLNAFVS